MTISPRELRQATGRFASGVTVITTAEDQNDDAVHGMTANSFTSVSLDPPLVLVSIGKNARMHERIMCSGTYGVSVLADAQSNLSTHFAGRPGDHKVEFVWQNGIPLVSGALSHIACTVEDAHPAGDHTLFIGRVQHLSYDHGRPLVFYTGGYRDLQLIDRDDPWSI